MLEDNVLVSAQMSRDAGREQRIVPYFDDMILSKILSLLDDEDLLRMRVVSHCLRRLVDNILRERFIERWGICGIERLPPSPAAYVCCQLHHFVFAHTLAGSAESLPTLAVRYNVQLAALRRLNNILNDRAVSSRTAVLIPASKSHLHGAPVSFQNSSIASRPLWIVGTHTLSDRDVQRSAISSRISSHPSTVERNILLLRRAFKIDRETASFYLLQAGGDIKSAILAYKDDMQWVDSLGRRTRTR
jgi:hypothetical protein